MSRTSPAAPAPSASGQVARAAPDGYTLLIGGAGPLLTSPAINPNVGYDTLRDFTHIAMIAGDGYVLISNPGSNLKTFADVKREGGQKALTTASPGGGLARSPDHRADQAQGQRSASACAVPQRGRKHDGGAGQSRRAGDPDVQLGRRAGALGQGLGTRGDVRRARPGVQGCADLHRARPGRHRRRRLVLADRARETAGRRLGQAQRRGPPHRETARHVASASRTTRW